MILLTIVPFMIVNLPLSLDSISISYEIRPYFDYNTQNRELYKSLTKPFVLKNFFEQQSFD